MAELQTELADPASVVLQTLSVCLDLEPENAAAVALRERLEETVRQGAGWDDQGSRQLEARFAAREPVLPGFQMLCPPILRKASIVWWSALVVGWYLLASQFELMSGQGRSVVPDLLQMLCCLMCIAAVYLGYALTKRLRTPLSLQLDTMRLERFDRLFDDEMHRMFGNYVLTGNRLNWLESLRNERAYLLAHALWVLILTGSAFVLSGSGQIPRSLQPVRVLNFALMYFLVFFFVRFGVGLTSFVFRFSRISLKPMLTKINDDGLRSFGPLFSATLVLMALMYAAYWLMAALAIDLSAHGDLVFLGIGTMLYLIWSLALPFALKRAARQAKSKAVHVYADHIEQAFREFLEAPSEDRRQRYDWLIQNQRVIQRVHTWPMSWQETVFAVVGGNLVLLAVDGWYLMTRLGYLSLR